MSRDRFCTCDGLCAADVGFDARMVDFLATCQEAACVWCIDAVSARDVARMPGEVPLFGGDAA